MALPTPPSPASDNPERLRNMLSLLAYEVPPPGYFDSFSSKVLARVQAGAQDPAPGWWESMLTAVWARPWARASVALAMAGLVVTGFGKASALHLGLADVDPFLSGAPAVVQAAMLDWTLIQQAEEPVLLSAGEIGGVAPTLPEPRSWAPGFPRSGAVVRASFTPAY
jgi:hypothetical protein